jgi:hypothetical protein
MRPRQCLDTRRAGEEDAHMIIGAHILLYSKDPQADRAFLRDVLLLRAIDIGAGWIIFELPPAEAAVHPSNGEFAQRHGGHNLVGALLYFMCDDLHATVESLCAKHVTCSDITVEPWGVKTTIQLPSGGEIGLYQPTHPTAIGPAAR